MESLSKLQKKYKSALEKYEDFNLDYMVEYYSKELSKEDMEDLQRQDNINYDNLKIAREAFLKAKQNGII